jgi:drug/metabolite transporter (DMT)-like permease
MSLISVLLILAAIACGATGRLTCKAGMTRAAVLGVGGLSGVPGTALRFVHQPLVIVQLARYVIGAGVWLVVLSRVPLRLAYPSLALSYVLTAFLASWLSSEQVSGQRWAGIAAISFGVVLISNS